MPPNVQMPQMPAGMPMVGGMGQQDSTNLLNILVDIAFGFAGGLMIFFGPQPVITYGTHLAMDLLKQTGYGSGPLAAFGLASAAPYVVLAPVGGFALKELAAVRSIRSFAFFAVSVLIGLAIAYFTQGYFAPLIH
jgi:hypothetical protein